MPRRLAALTCLLVLSAVVIAEDEEPGAKAAPPIALEILRDGPPVHSRSFDALVQRGRSLAGGGRAALLGAREIVGGAPSKRDVREWAVRFRDTGDLGEAWACAQAIRFRDHVHLGSIWTHDSEAERIVRGIAAIDPIPVRRALAAECLGDVGQMRALLLDENADPLLRAFGAIHLGAPGRVTESAARRVLDPMFELLRHDDPNVRSLVALAVPAWCATLDQQRVVIERARTDASPGVRAALFDALHVFGVPTARAILDEIASDEAEPESVRSLAVTARSRLAIHPD